MSSTSPLLLDRRFAPLFGCQALSAFGDNLLRNAVGLTLIWSGQARLGALLVPLSAACLVLPSLLLSGQAASLAIRFDKAWLTRRLKLIEIATACVAAVGLLAHLLPLVLLGLLGTGTVATFFFPIKYGLPPQMLERSRLPGASALIEGSTFLAILAGTSGAGLLIGPLGERGIGLLIVAASAAAWLVSLAIPRGMAPVGAVQSRSEGSFRLLASLLRRPDARAAALGNAWFWLVGAVALSSLPSLVHDTLHGSPRDAGLCASVFAVGVAVGSGLASTLSGGRFIALVAVLGSAATALGLGDLSWWTQRLVAAPVPATGWRLVLDLGVAAAGAGLLAVPTMARLQGLAGAAETGRLLGALNVLSALAVVLGSGALMLGQAAGLRPPALLGACAAACAVVTVLLQRHLVTNTIGDLAWIVVRLAFQVRRLCGR